MCRASGPWESKNSEKDIEEVKLIQTREKVNTRIFEINCSMISVFKCSIETIEKYMAQFMSHL